MGLLDSFMPGESMGIPQQKGLLDDRLDDPLFQLGISILANNNSRDLGQVLGRGALQGMQSIRQGRQIKSDQQYRDVQLKRQQQEQLKYEREQAALDDFDTKFPEYKGLAQLDPKAALKIAYPNASLNSVDPYFTPLATEAGLGSFNNRTGQYELITGADGRPVIKTTDSPLTRGAVKEAEARATAGYDINTSIPGVVSTDRQIAEQANPMLGTQNQVQPQIINGRRTIPAQQMPSNGFSTPYPVTFGAPGTTATDLAEGVTGENSIQLRNPANPSRPAGIQIRLPEEQAALTEAAKMQATNQQQAQQDLTKVVDGSNRALRQIDELVGSVDGKIKPHAGFQTAVGASSKFDPRNYLPGTDAAGFKARLDQSKGGTFLQAFESLKGAGQITEIEGVKATTAIDRMNTATTEEEFVKAARDYQDVIRSATERAKKKAGNGSILPSDSAMPKVRRYNQKTGKIE